MATFQEYKGFTIKVNNYLRNINGNKDEDIDFEKSTNYFYSIWQNGKCLYDTLWNDDKMWGIDNAIKSAKDYIDNQLIFKQNYNANKLLRISS